MYPRPVQLEGPVRFDCKSSSVPPLAGEWNVGVQTLF